MSSGWSVLAVRYGTLETTRAEAYYRYQAYGEPDGPQRLDYFFWIVRCPDETILVDVNSVFFVPGARTHWHRHGIAQVLHVTHGRGLLWSSDEGRGVVLEPGDVAHIPAGERHWHGGAPDSYLLHLAISVGPADWLEPVSDDEYQEAVDALA